MSFEVPAQEAFNEIVLRKLEFNKVLESLANLAVSDVGKTRIRLLKPHTNPHTIENELKKVSEAKEILIAEGTIPLDGFRDITVALKKTYVENQVLTIAELLDVATILSISKVLKSFLSKRSQLCPLIAAYIPKLFIDKVVEFNITQALDEQGVVKDSASKELRSIRRQLIDSIDALRKKLESILKNVSDQEVLQEEIITTRDGRLVIPVKTEFKNRIPGFIHSTSVSGATVYIEPAESLALNNEVRELQLLEQREIYRILSDLTKQVAGIRDELTNTLEALIDLDSIIARAKYSIEIIGNAPALSDTPRIKLQNARHPILLRHVMRDQVVPLTLELGGEERTLIITGPNAGGKTVALKLIGLLALCTQSGIHIPADPDSVVYPFQRIFVDIGDDQSIDNDLSTFSSHLLSLKKILEEAHDSSLVLIDEIGTGTDPSEGGAIAAGTLQALNRRNILTIITTHQGMLKVFAHQTKGIVNGSMEFDALTLRPTYRYRHGIPGGSYAFELAGRIGMPPDVLQTSKDYIGDNKVRIETFLVELERQIQQHSAKLKDVIKEKEKLESLVKSYEQKNLQLKREVGVIKRQAVEEAKGIIENAHSRIEKSIQEIREGNAKTSIIKASKQALKDIHIQITKIDSEIPQIQENEVFAVGDIVKLKVGGSKSGEIIAIHKDIVTVLSGPAKLQIHARDLKKSKKNDNHSDFKSSLQILENKVDTSIDLRGLLGDEAIAAVQTFLDNAYSSGLHRVDIIHGKGTGALRKRIAEFLKIYPHIKSFKLGEWNEGGSGVTVVELP